MAYGVSNGHVTDDITWPRTSKGQTRDPNTRTLRAQYLENSWSLEMLFSTIAAY